MRAEDAAELVDIDIADLPVVIDAVSAGASENTAAELTLGYGDTTPPSPAPCHVVSIELAIGRHTGVPLEPRCLLAVPGPENPDRGEFYPEDFLIPWLAVRLGRPVRWAEDRAEHLMAANHSRQQHHRIAAALRRRPDHGPAGRHRPRQRRLLPDPRRRRPELTVAMLPRPYRIPAYRGRVLGGAYQQDPCGTSRALGRFEGTSAREHLLDVAATQLGIDPWRPPGARSLA